MMGKDPSKVNRRSGRRGRRGKGYVYPYQAQPTMQPLFSHRPKPKRFDEIQRPLRFITQEEFLRMKAEGYGRLYINKQIRRRTPMVFVLYDETLRGIILRKMPYNLDLLVNGERRRINKLDIKYCYKQAHEPKILPYIEVDDAVKALNLGPEMDPSKRYQIDDKVLLQCHKERRPIILTLRGGEVIKGVIDWFSKYEIKIELPSRKSVVCFRHAVYSLSVAIY